MGELQERITSTKKGSITSVQAILVPREYRPYPWGVVLPLGIAASLALLGIVFALVGLARLRGRGLARVALLVNAIVLLLTALASLAMLYILRR